MTTQRIIGIVLVVVQAGLTTALLNIGDLGAPAWAKFAISVASTMVTVAAVLIDPKDDSVALPPHG